MPLLAESLDSLPYIDAQASEQERNAIRRLIAAELPTNYQNSIHPALPPLTDTRASELIQPEINRKSKGQPMREGVDLTRYEAPEEPEADSDVESWRTALQQAYISSSYLKGRITNLSLLEEFGKNAWLIGNSQFEEILQNLEKELAILKEETESVNRARKYAQEGSIGELTALEDSWRTGVGKIIEVQVATDGVRKEILKRRRVH